MIFKEIVKGRIDGVRTCMLDGGYCKGKNVYQVAIENG